MHKSWGNAIEFDEAAERMGVDVMRWMYARHRPEDNILFGWHAADEARRGLLVLWNVYAFFVTYAGLAGWTPSTGAPPVAERPALDRWILSRTAAVAAEVEARLRDYDAEAATRVVDAHMDDLSTWYLRLSRRRMSRGSGADRDAAFATLHTALVALARTRRPDPAVPRRRDVRQPRRRGGRHGARQRPPDRVARRGGRAAARRAARGGRVGGATRRGPVAHAARAGRAQGPPAARDAVARAAGRDARRARRAARADPRRGERQGRRAHRGRVGARRPRREGAAAARRQAPRVEDPGRDGGRPRGPVRDPRRRLGDASRARRSRPTRSRSRRRRARGRPSPTTTAWSRSSTRR